MRENKNALLERTNRIVRALAQEYPAATCALNHSNPFELLIATILSAQCTDERVNIVTAMLFRKYRSCQDYLSVTQTELERDINSVTFFRNKSKAIQSACLLLTEKYGGQVPKTLEELTELPGVGRKTANVVLGTAFGIPSGVVVDTHVSRLSQRLRLTKQAVPEKIEEDLMRVVPQEEWIDFAHRMIWHGRRVCKARKPDCQHCVLEKFCPSSTLRGRLTT
jgi:endonuclease III